MYSMYMFMLERKETVELFPRRRNSHKNTSKNKKQSFRPVCMHATHSSSTMAYEHKTKTPTSSLLKGGFYLSFFFFYSLSPFSAAHHLYP